MERRKELHIPDALGSENRLALGYNEGSDAIAAWMPLPHEIDDLSFIDREGAKQLKAFLEAFLREGVRDA